MFTDAIRFAQSYQKLSQAQKQAISRYAKNPNKPMSDFLRKVTYDAIEDLLTPFDSAIVNDADNLPDFVSATIGALVNLDM